MVTYSRLCRSWVRVTSGIESEIDGVQHVHQFPGNIYSKHTPTHPHTHNSQQVNTNDKAGTKSAGRMGSPMDDQNEISYI